MPTSHTTHSFKEGTHPPNTLHYQDRGYARSCNPYTSENATSTRLAESKGIEDRPVFAIPYVRACYGLGRKSHRNADSTVGSVPSRSPFPAFLSRFSSSS